MLKVQMSIDSWGGGGDNSLKKRMVREPDRQLKDVDISILITSVIF